MAELKWLVLIHAAATLMMAGVMLVIQLVHYPLFALVGENAFPAYEAAHMGSILLVVGPLMLIEAGTGLLLVGAQPPGVAPWLAYAGFALIGLVWLLTILVNAPQHIQLANGFNAAVHAALVASNGWRTLAWLVRAGLVIVMLGGLLASGTPAPSSSSTP